MTEDVKAAATATEESADKVKAADGSAREKTKAELAAEAEANEPREDKIKRLIAGYEHGLASNAPRTTAELAEIKALLAE